MVVTNRYFYCCLLIVTFLAMLETALLKDYGRSVTLTISVVLGTLGGIIGVILDRRDEEKNRIESERKNQH